MTRIVVLVLTFWALSPLAMAEEWTGYLADAKCVKERIVATENHASCAVKCVKGGGFEVVFVTEDGNHVYKIKNQGRVLDYVGQRVTLEGRKDDDTIVVDSVDSLK